MGGASWWGGVNRYPGRRDITPLPGEISSYSIRSNTPFKTTGQCVGMYTSNCCVVRVPRLEAEFCDNYVIDHTHFSERNDIILSWLTTCEGMHCDDLLIVQ